MFRENDESSFRQASTLGLMGHSVSAKPDCSGRVQSEEFLLPLVDFRCSEMPQSSGFHTHECSFKHRPPVHRLRLDDLVRSLRSRSSEVNTDELAHGECPSRCRRLQFSAIPQ
jgi:hypothetical protein